MHSNRLLAPDLGDFNEQQPKASRLDIWFLGKVLSYLFLAILLISLLLHSIRTVLFTAGGIPG